MENKKSFEENMKELESIVTQLQNGQSDLDKAYDLFEKGIKIAKECEKKLNEVKASVAKIVEDGKESEFNEENE